MLRLPSKAPGVKLTKARSPSEIMEIHFDRHMEFPPSVATWPIADPCAAMSTNNECNEQVSLLVMRA